LIFILNLFDNLLIFDGLFDGLIVITIKWLAQRLVNGLLLDDTEVQLVIVLHLCQFYISRLLILHLFVVFLYFLLDLLLVEDYQVFISKLCIFSQVQGVNWVLSEVFYINSLLFLTGWWILFIIIMVTLINVLFVVHNHIGLSHNTNEFIVELNDITAWLDILAGL